MSVFLKGWVWALELERQKDQNGDVEGILPDELRGLKFQHSHFGHVQLSSFGPWTWTLFCSITCEIFLNSLHNTSNDYIEGTK